MKVEDLMTRDVVSCGPGDSVSHAAQLMWEHDCGIVPIVDSERRPIGLITDRDACMAGFTTGRALNDIRVGDVMSQSVRVCKLRDSLEAAETAMRQARVRRVPIVDEDGHLIGILSLNDLARAAAARQKKHRDTQGAVRVTDTLAAICQPWCDIVDSPKQQASGDCTAREPVVSVPLFAR
ncbi:MAG: CBS domain-containing protein [Planctomycetes bacterium]|nr:CBS domain-containing protein [Planctomycetota bacterium]